VPFLFAMSWSTLAIVLGVAMIRGYEPKVRLPAQTSSTSAQQGRGFRGFYVFGICYALASLSCVLPIFLVVVSISLTAAGFVGAAATSLVYGAGMGLLLMGVTLAVALGKQSMIGWLRRSSRHVSRVAGGILVLAGAYILFFWISVLATGGLTESAVIRTFELFQARLVNLIGGAAPTIGLALAAVLLIAVAYVWRSRQPTSRRSRHR
jgi:cytochrome c-type biogenesis protein